MEADWPDAATVAAGKGTGTGDDGWGGRLELEPGNGSVV